MSTTLVLRLPWGRFHATPWDRNVNEGVVEWPPSPWRLLRALYATWKTRAAHLEAETVHALLERLAEPPSFVLPPYRLGHTRHYLPDTSHRSGAPSTDKILDAFVVTERDAEVAITWHVDLPARECDVLSQLAEALPHVGRADSLCLARVVDEPPRDGATCRPLAVGEEAPKDYTVARLLVADAPLRFDDLTVRTTDVRHRRLARPRGTSWVNYAVPDELGEVRRRRPGGSKRITAARWVVAGRARPSAYATVAITHVLRAACQSAYGQRFDNASSPQLSGKDENGEPLRGHAHAHYFALDQPDTGAARGDRRVEDLLVWVPEGMDEQVIAAVAVVHLGGLRGHRHISDFRPLRLGLEAVGTVETVAPELVGPATVWESHTPFAPARHRKRGQDPRAFLEAEVSRELAFRGVHLAPSVTALPGDWLAFRRHRPDRQRLAEAHYAVGLRLTFPKPVTGPLALGALSHFGLGLLTPIR